MRDSTCAQRLGSQVKLGEIAHKESQLKAERCSKGEKKVEEMAGERRKEEGMIGREKREEVTKIVDLGS